MRRKLCWNLFLFSVRPEAQWLILYLLGALFIFGVDGDAQLCLLLLLGDGWTPAWSSALLLKKAELFLTCTAGWNTTAGSFFFFFNWKRQKKSALWTTDPFGFVTFLVSEAVEQKAGVTAAFFPKWSTFKS